MKSHVLWTSLIIWYIALVVLSAKAIYRISDFDYDTPLMDVADKINAKHFVSYSDYDAYQLEFNSRELKLYIAYTDDLIWETLPIQQILIPPCYIKLEVFDTEKQIYRKRIFKLNE